MKARKAFVLSERLENKLIKTRSFIIIFKLKALKLIGLEDG